MVPSGKSLAGPDELLWTDGHYQQALKEKHVNLIGGRRC